MAGAEQEVEVEVEVGAKAPGSFYTSGYIIKEMKEGNDPMGRTE